MTAARALTTVVDIQAATEGEQFVQDIKANLEGRDVAPCGWLVMLAIYKRPKFKILANGEKFHFAERTRDEDVYQGNIGYVLSMGTEAYATECFPAGAWCKPGDWVLFSATENAARRFDVTGVDGKPVPLVMVSDDKIMGVVPEPGVATRVR